MTKKISIGRIVHVQIREGKYRPAIVTEVHNVETGSINANAFMDYSDGEIMVDDSHFFKWYVSIVMGEAVGQWKWPERV